MIRLSNLADYAVVVMTAAARASAARSTAAVTAGGVAARSGVPAPTVAKLMTTLARAGLLASTRGAGGGAMLARPAAAISLAEIVEAIDGPIALTSCTGDASGCALHGSCGVRPHWGPVNRAVREALAAVTLADLAGAPATAPALEIA